MGDSLKRRVEGSLYAVELMQLVKSSDKEDSQRHYLEYCKDQRWGYVP